jgi:cell division protein FtsZ
METNSSRPVHHTPIDARLPVIKVMGLGGAGSNAINRMMELGLAGVEYIVANTDHQALASSAAPVKIQLGPHVTRGLGAGGRPQTGESAAEESFKEITEALQGADMVFLTAGMGGGTGTGSIPVAARIARHLGILTVAIVTMPFSFEVGRRQKNAADGLAALRPFVDTLITVPNDRLLQIAPHDLPLDLAFRLADDVLRQGIQGISELILETGLINVDFAHIRNLIQKGGGSYMSIGQGEGENKAVQAVERALHHPLLDEIAVEQASGIIANFSGGADLTFLEIAEALTYLQEKTGRRADIIPGVITVDAMSDRAQVILIITGLGATAVEETVVTQPAERQVYTPQTTQQILDNAYDFSQPFRRPEPELPQAPEISYPDLTDSIREEAAHNAPEPSLPPLELIGSANNLDIPAFLRRRVK